MQTECESSISWIVIGYVRAYVNGDRTVWEEAGFTEDEISHLASLTVHDLYEFCATSAHVFNFDLNHGRFSTHRRVRDQHRHANDKQTKLIKLDSPASLLTRLFGLSTTDRAAIRQRLGMPQRGGRPNTLTEDHQAIAWRIWKNTKGIPAADRLLAIGDSGIPLKSAWSTVSIWMDKEALEHEVKLTTKEDRERYERASSRLTTPE